MINFCRHKTLPEHSLWFGVNGFRYNTGRNSQSRDKKVRDIGWYFYIYIFGYELMVNRERVEEIA